MHRADQRHPGWEFKAHVGYSTPEHRAAIRRLGVSPLHRLSFQSMAYQQLDLIETVMDQHSPLDEHSEGSFEVIQAE
jgi:ribonuclease HII